MNTRKIVLICSFSLGGLTGSAFAQVDSTLAATSPTVSVIAGTKLTAELTVRIEPGWHISSLTTPDGGPVKTKINLGKGQPFKMTGKIDAPEPMRHHSDAFGVDVETYEGEVVFTLPLEATGPVAADQALAVEITYQVCSDEKCQLPHTEKLTAPIVLKYKDEKRHN